MSLEEARRKIASGDEVAALACAQAALGSPAPPEESVALRVLAARAARSIGDLALEIAHLEAGEDLASSAVPAALGGVRLQLGLALLRRGEARRAAGVLSDALPLFSDDPDIRARVEAALSEARGRAVELDRGVARARGSVPRAGVRSSRDGDGASRHPAAGVVSLEQASRRARARVLGLLEKLQELDPDATAHELLEQFLDLMIDAVKADRGFVLLAEPEGLRVHVAHDAHGHQVVNPEVEVSSSIARAAAVEGRTIVLSRPAEDPRFASSRSAQRLALIAVCAAPLRYRRESLGVVVLDRRTEARRASEPGFARDAELLVTQFARGAAAIIVRARRHDAERLAHQSLLEQYARDTERSRRRFQANRIVGTSPGIARLLRLVEKVAPRDVRVVIRGESGTGKELVARTIHENSPRHKGPFVALNCGALADNLVETQLFGHVQGAYTGATRGSAGILRAAHEGTLFLDEVAEASPKLQAALLRFLESGEVRPVGASEVSSVDTRVLAATHRDLEGLVATGHFREDLFHRLNVFSVFLPPLRERPEDIPLLARQFAAETTGGEPLAFLTAAVEESLAKRLWPGNVRELRNAIVQLAALGQLPATERPTRRAPAAAWKDGGEVVPTLRECERRAIQAALGACAGNKSRAARMLGISRRGLYYLLVDHGIGKG